MVEVRGANERDGDEMVSEHLPMVLATLLDVNDKNLLYPESPLRQEVTLHETTEFPDRPPGPKLLHI